MTPRLETIGLSLGYEGEVFARGIDLTLDPAEIVAVLGPSGSGKSTLLNTIAGVVPAMDGRVLVDGRDVTRTPIHRRGVGLIFQQPLLFPHLNVRDNVAYGLRRQGLGRDAARRQADELLSWVDLAGYGDRRFHELSGGQAQRVALARALAPRPSVLLLDEPFSALDLDLRQRLAADVADTLRQHGVAALHVTHDPGEAAAVADRVVALEDLFR
ncbi:MAG: ATP-binding cassette domain-containing protein [Actinomycetales bacterium]|nr:ATP-binding cassette domain-containing protein [Actinomycetales bacterium]